MSADNWTTCPRCVDNIMDEYKKNLEKVKKQYGKIDAEEYIKLHEEAQYAPSIETTLREDYEFDLEAGELHISYRCHCSKCGFSFKHEDYKTIYQGDKKDGE